MTHGRVFRHLAVALLLILTSAVALAGPTTFTSDDFNSYNLKRPLWSYIDPLNDGTVRLTGVNTNNAYLTLTVPGGSSHDIWNNGYEAPRIMQACSNTDFQAEVKFESGLTGVTNRTFQAQGIVVEADANNVIRFDFTTGNTDSVRVFSAAFIGGFATPSVKIDKGYLSYGVSPMWMRVRRVGNVWTVFASKNGTAWDSVGSFTQALTVTKIGLFVANAGSQSIATTAIVDYFMNTDSLIVPEDGARGVVDNLGPLVHNVHAMVASNAIQLTWKTDEAASSTVKYGQTTGYGNTEDDPALTTDHLASVVALTQNTLYHYQITGTDNSGNTDGSSDYSVTTATPSRDVLSYSDDFNAASLNTAVWSFSNPQSDGSQSIVNKALVINVPGGTAHDIWTSGDKTVKIYQPIENKDLQVVVKFTTPINSISGSTMMEGLVFEADSLNKIRIDFSNSGTGTQLFAASFLNGFSSPIIEANTPMDIAGFGVSPLWLRVSRSGALWILETSTDGTSFTTKGQFFRIINVTKVGVFAGNSGTTPPPVSVGIDYFLTSLPAKPALVAPATGSLNVATNAVASWDTASATTSYRLQVASDSLFAAVVLNDSTLTAPSRLFSGLGNSTKYFWRVRGKNPVGLGLYSPTYSFTTTAPAPGTPVPIAPNNLSTNLPVSLTIRWTKLASALTYKLQVGTDSTFATGLVVNDSTLTDTSKAVSGLTNDTQYFWRVAAANFGGTSAFSPVWRFSTISALPSVPVLASPANGAVDQPLAFSLLWRRASSAEHYRVQLATDSLFTALVVNDSTLTDTVKAVSGLTNLTKYYWRVNARNFAGTTVYSSVWSLTTIVAAPAVPTTLAPANNAVNLPITASVRWSRVANAATYHLQLGTDSTFATGLVVNDSTITDTVKTGIGIQYNQKYFWRVQAKNVGGTSAYSATVNFRTLPGDPTVPVPLAPANGATNQANSLTLRWTRPSGATSFHLQLGTDSTFATGLVVNDPALTDTLRNVTSLTYLTKYFWRINADNIGGTSPYSPVFQFTVGIPLPSTVVPVAPANGLVTHADSIRLTWNRSTPQVSKYWLEISIDSNMVNFVNADSSLTDTTKMVRGLISNTTYYWRVRAKNPGGWNTPNTVRSFRFVVTDVPVAQSLPTQFGLAQNYPNPFNPTTMIEYSVPRESRVRVEIYNIIGERVALLVDEVKGAGTYRVSFDASNLASGLYLYRMAAGDKSFTRKMMLLK